MDAAAAVHSPLDTGAPSGRPPFQRLARDDGAGPAAAQSEPESGAGMRGPWPWLRRALLGVVDDPRDV